MSLLAISVISLVGIAVVGWVISLVSYSEETPITTTTDTKPKEFSPRYDLFDAPAVEETKVVALPDHSFGYTPSTTASQVSDAAIELLAASVIVDGVEQDSSSYLSDILPSVITSGTGSPIARGSKVETGIVHSI